MSDECEENNLKFEDNFEDTMQNFQSMYMGKVNTTKVGSSPLFD